MFKRNLFFTISRSQTPRNFLPTQSHELVCRWIFLRFCISQPLRFIDLSPKFHPAPGRVSVALRSITQVQSIPGLPAVARIVGPSLIAKFKFFLICILPIQTITWLQFRSLPRISLGPLSPHSQAIRRSCARPRRRPLFKTPPHLEWHTAAHPR